MTTPRSLAHVVKVGTKLAAPITANNDPPVHRGWAGYAPVPCARAVLAAADLSDHLADLGVIGLHPELL